MNKIEGLSVIIITRDEEEDIQDCLESVKNIAGEIVVVDSGSTDKTLEICRKYTDKIYHSEWKGFSALKQFALDKAKGPWVINIDSDERITPELDKEIAVVLKSNGSAGFNGYAIPFQTFFLKKKLRFGASMNETHVRLFKKDKGAYGDDAVHEGINVEKPVGRLKNSVAHFSYSSLAEYLSKCNLYTTLIANKKFKKGERFHFWHHFRLPYEFMIRYIVKLGFLDGAEGFIYALLSSYYVWLKFMKLRELERK